MAEIDVEDENILTSIFKDSFPESWQENPDFVHYLVELSSYGADRLAREPDRLAEEKAQILAETQDLAFHNYTTFIQTADCSKEIFQDFQIIEQHLDDLLTKLPNFSDECGNVIKKAQEISSSRRMNTLTLQRHTQLLEVLEMPQLMDTCVRNGYYEEALELAGHVKRLEKKHPNITVIASIVREVKASTQLMLNQLIQQLRTNLQLPACLRVIGFLRRMDVFTEAELRIKFLQARDSWFQNILDAIPKGDAYNHITKTIEASRVHLFDIMTQFRAIFSDEDPLVSTGRGEAVNESLLFHSWVLQKISQFLVILETDLEEGIGGRLDSILGQCMYFGLSFSRVGADFRGLLAPIFERAALRYFSVALRDANKKFEENMQSYNLLGLTTTGGLPFGMGSSQSGQLYPPTTLLDFYPLAAYCNHVLTALNDLRLCAPLNLACKVADQLQGSLMGVNRIILAFHRAEETTFNEKEKDQFEQFCATYATDLLPFVNKCMQALFPPSQLANTLGLTVSEINKKGNIGQVDLSTIMDNVNHLMPAAPALTNIKPEVEDTKPVRFSLDSDGEDNLDEHGQESKQMPVSPLSIPNQAENSSSVTSALPEPEDGVTVPVIDQQQSSPLDPSIPFSQDVPPSIAPDVVLDPGTLASAGQGQETLAPDLPPVLPPFASDEVETSGVTGTSDAERLTAPKVLVGAEKSDVAEEPKPSPFAITEQTESEGGWNSEGLDLDNLDEVNLEGMDSTVDLDFLPSPAEASSSKQD